MQTHAGAEISIGCSRQLFSAKTSISRETLILGEQNTGDQDDNDNEDDDLNIMTTIVCLCVCLSVIYRRPPHLSISPLVLHQLIHVVAKISMHQLLHIIVHVDQRYQFLYIISYVDQRYQCIISYISLHRLIKDIKYINSDILLHKYVDRRYQLHQFQHIVAQIC